MDINLLVLSVGNSRLALGSFIAGELRSVQRIDHAQRDQWVPAIKSAWEGINRDIGDGNAAIAGVCVNPPLLEPLEHVTQQATGRAVRWVGREIDLPIPVLTDHPDQTGVDRIVNIAAAFEQIGNACVVVDAGTAITVDMCDEKGAFLGGAIAPGMRLMLDSLHEKTARLPRAQITSTDIPAVGRSTEAAIRSGVFHGIRGMVRELVEQYATQLSTWPPIIATGGDAKLLFEGWELIHAVAPDLTLYGTALAYTHHHITHET